MANLEGSRTKSESRPLYIRLDGWLSLGRGELASAIANTKLNKVVKSDGFSRSMRIAKFGVDIASAEEAIQRIAEIGYRTEMRLFSTERDDLMFDLTGPRSWRSKEGLDREEGDIGRRRVGEEIQVSPEKGGGHRKRKGECHDVRFAIKCLS